MSRAAAAATGLLALSLAGALPAAGQPWVGERLCAPQPLPAGAELGSAVAVGGDGTIAVGDYRHDVVYLFQRDAAGHCLSASIQGERGSWFGFSLAIDGNRLLVGAPEHRGTGAAFWADLTDGKPASALRQVQGLGPPPAAGDEAGSAVAIEGTTLAIGARGADGRRGRVYAGGDGGLTAVPQPADLAPRAELGQSVALRDKTLVMGAPYPFRGSGSPGAAYVVELAGSPGTPTALSTAWLEPEAAFGYAVAVDGGRILVGAPLADRNGVDAGAVLSFQHGGGGWALDRQLAGGKGDQLGVAVALDGNLGVIGARYAGGARGAAYLLRGQGALEPLAQAVPAGAQFGFSVAIHGTTAAVGAFREDGTGAAYRFDAPPVDSPVTVEFAAPASSVLASAGTAPLQVIVHGPAGALSAPIAVDLTILPQRGTARPGVDFTLVEPLSYVIPPGTRTGVPFTLTSAHILPAPLGPSPKAFWVQLSPAAAGGRSIHQVIIYESPLVVPAGPLHTSEAGGSAPLEVRLAVRPAADVVVSLETSDGTEGIVSPSRLRFTPGDWDRIQTARVAGQDDALCDGAQAYEVRAVTTSADRSFDGLSLSIPAENADDEQACLTAGKSVCTDGGGTVVYTISLANSVAGGPDVPAQLLDLLPPEVSVVTASADRGTAIADPVANSVQWSGPVPSAGGTATITIVAALDVPPSPAVKNRAGVTYVRDGRGHQGTVQTNEVALPGDPCP